jgi:predicted ribosomally synthesized peptide with nif11-like leader
MSREAAQAFIEKMKSDAAFRAKVMADEDVEARPALIPAEGLDCSAEEIGALQELSEAELSGAVGGGERGLVSPGTPLNAKPPEVWRCTKAHGNPHYP